MGAKDQWELGWKKREYELKVSHSIEAFFLVLLELSSRRHGVGALGGFLDDTSHRREFEVKDEDATGLGRLTRKDNLAAQVLETKF